MSDKLLLGAERSFTSTPLTSELITGVEPLATLYIISSVCATVCFCYLKQGLILYKKLF